MVVGSMKIIVDKIAEYPRHAITRADIHLILSSVPSAWTEHIKIVRLSASRSATAMALYARSVETLTIASRGYTKADTLRFVLAELAAWALGFKQRTFQHLPARYASRVDGLIAPLVREILPQISQKRLITNENVV